jgi:hypothetical protein
MKATTIFLLVLTLGIVVTGCTKNITSDTGALSGGIQNTANATVDDLGIDQTTTPNPDVGMLDDSPVSDSLPQ